MALLTHTKPGFARFLPALILGISLSCITPLDVSTDREVNLLVVEGFISTIAGPHKITITRSAKYGSIFESIIEPERFAEVWIKDNDGNLTSLIDVGSDGIYETPQQFKGEIGKSYILNIITSSGVEYASLPQKILPVPKLDSIYFQYKKQPTTDLNKFTSGMEVFGIWNDPEDQENYYMWRNTGNFLVITFPELFTLPGFPPFIRPKDCCKFCYITESMGDAAIYIRKDNNTNGVKNIQQVAFIEDNGSRFTIGYHLSVQQISISKEAFQFFNLLKNQKSIDGDIFDPPPATVRGNIYPLNQEEAPVIGYFHASDVSELKLFLPRSELEDFQTLFEFRDDCRELLNSSTIPPDDWPL